MKIKALQDISMIPFNLKEFKPLKEGKTRNYPNELAEMLLKHKLAKGVRE